MFLFFLWFPLKGNESRYTFNEGFRRVKDFRGHIETAKPETCKRLSQNLGEYEAICKTALAR
jgi:hypothetical protein